MVLLVLCDAAGKDSQFQYELGDAFNVEMLSGTKFYYYEMACISVHSAIFLYRVEYFTTTRNVSEPIRYPQYLVIQQIRNFLLS